MKKVSREEIKKAAKWPSKVYAVDGNGNVIGLQLDGYAVSLDAELADLSHLTRLVLRDAHLERPDVLKTLKGLTSLDLSKTQVTDLCFVELLPSLVQIYVSGAERLEEPPLQIAEKGHEAIRNYFRQKREQGRGYRYEAKALIVGEPGAGKTSLRKKLIDPLYPIPNKEEPSTLGAETEHPF